MASAIRTTSAWQSVFGRFSNDWPNPCVCPKPQCSLGAVILVTQLSSIDGRSNGVVGKLALLALMIACNVFAGCYGAIVMFYITRPIGSAGTESRNAVLSYTALTRSSSSIRCSTTMSRSFHAGR